MSRAIDCPVCGDTCVISAYGSNPREAGHCQGCGSFNRQRQLALVLLATLRRAGHGDHRSLAALVASGSDVRIHSTEIGGAVHRTLSELTGYTCSEYLGADVESGTVIGGVRHENLLGTSFDDAAIDVLLSADVLEHIPEPYEAHREIHRILSPGGAHVFTVPSNMAMHHDSQRAAVVGGEVHLFAPPEYHGAETDALLVYTIFGAEMLDHLGALGLTTAVHELDVADRGVVGPGAVVYEAVRTTEPTGAQVPGGLRLDRIPQPEPSTGPRAAEEFAARVFLDRGDAQDALESYLAIADRHGPGPWTLLGIADAALALGDRLSALDMARLTLDHWPWRWDARDRIAHIEAALLDDGDLTVDATDDEPLVLGDNATSPAPATA